METNRAVSNSSPVSSYTPEAAGPRLKDEKTKRVNLADSTMEIRDSMRAIKILPLDSSVWEFKNDEMTVTIEQGYYNGPLEKDYGDLDYLEFQKVVDGEECKITTLKFADASEYKEPKKQFNVNARFKESPRVGNPVSIFIIYQNAESKQIALDMIDSVRFTSQPKKP
ncbi:MAG TPA: hypothetical protein PLP21_02255 [Pyrinomonadaceae bacterium]|nr:hypothetical protein [Acidobacteriota bacterium]HQZ95107.1 hypothetical protein [Pyrinomonadaceae bacterium]